MLPGGGFLRARSGFNAEHHCAVAFFHTSSACVNARRGMKKHSRPTVGSVLHWQEL